MARTARTARTARPPTSEVPETGGPSAHSESGAGPPVHSEPHDIASEPRAASVAAATAELTAPGQFFEMEEAPVLGTRLRVWKYAPQSLRAVLELSREHGDAEYLVFEGERLCFEDHFRNVATLAHRLRHECAITKGERVAIAMRNLPEWVVTFWATVSLGAIAVPLNAWWTQGELAYALADSGAAVVVADRERAEHIKPILAQLPELRAMVLVDEARQTRLAPAAGRPGHRPVLAPAGRSSTQEPNARIVEWDYQELIGQVADDAELPDASIDPDDDATIFYTSGTTGHPKGAVGTHRNAVSNLMNLLFLSARLEALTGTAITAGNGDQSIFLLSIPLFHATGCHAIMISYTAIGGRLVLMHHFDPEVALELIEREGVTNFGGVPAMVMQIIDTPGFARRDVSSVRSISYGGAPAPPDLVRRIRDALPNVQTSNGYGLTETSATTTMNSGPDYLRKPDSVGPAVPVTDLAIAPDTRRTPGARAHNPSPAHGKTGVGELLIRGPQVVRGYWNRPTDTASTFTNGWLHTGDIAHIDEEGFVTVVDRAKDVIIRGGENVYSAEVEAALYGHPAVRDCAVIGLPDPVLGEVVGAVVVLRPESNVTAGQITDYLRTRLAAFAVPTHLWFRSQPLPRNPAGKVLKTMLRAQVLGDGAQRATR